MAINISGTTNTISPTSNSPLKFNAIAASEYINVMGNTSTNSVINLANGNFITVTLDSNVVFTITNVPSQAVSFTLILKNDATPGRSITWPNNIKWPGGSIPMRTTAANKEDVYKFFTIDSGATWYGNIVALNY